MKLKKPDETVFLFIPAACRRHLQGCYTMDLKSLVQ